jgi:hypothetical protein
MIGIILGLGFQWWVNLQEPWQYLAFIFVYLDIVDYWIDYGPSLKKFPPKKELDVFLDLMICFSLFLYIYATQFSLVYFLLSFMLVKALDSFWLLSSKLEYQPKDFDKKFINTWIGLNIIEVVITGGLIALILITPISSLAILIAYILIRLISRIIASTKYKKIYLTN